MEAFEVAFGPRGLRLPPAACAARAGIARALATQVLRRDDTALRRLTAVVAGDLLVLLGDEPDLPWVDGVTYLGREPSAPALLVPTSLTPLVAPALLLAALKRHAPDLAPPFAVLTAPRAVVGVGAARALGRAALLAWLTTQRRA